MVELARDTEMKTLPELSTPPAELAPRGDRERAFLKGIVTYANGAMTASVTVVQVSVSGARIMLDEGVTLPERFQIQIPRKGYDGPARLIWRRNGFAGIALSAEAAPAVVIDPSTELRQRIGELERENAKLRSQLALANASITRLSEGF